MGCNKIMAAEVDFKLEVLVFAKQEGKAESTLELSQLQSQQLFPCVIRIEVNEAETIRILPYYIKDKTSNGA